MAMRQEASGTVALRRKRVGDFLRRLRLSKNLSQAVMAQEMRLTASYYQRIEYGTAGVVRGDVVPLLKRVGYGNTEATALANSLWGPDDN